MCPIELVNVWKSFQSSADTSDEICILKDINFSLKEGKSTAIIGKSGSGKSTLLHVASGLDIPSSGKVLINGQDISGLSDREKSHLRNTNMGFIFQSNLLLEDFTAVENIMIPGLIQGRKKSFCKERAMHLLKSMELTERASHYPKQLSGGEKQRIAICRALMVEDVNTVFADEPTGSLDEENQLEVEEKLLSLVRNEGKTLLLVTHNNDFATKCDEIYLLQNKNLKKVEK